MVFNELKRFYNDTSAQVEMLQQTMYIFIVVAVLFAMSLVIPPVFAVIVQIDAVADHSGSLYYDVPAIFDLSVKIWGFFLVLIVVKTIIHLGLMAIKKQRYTGVSDREF